MAQTFNGIYIIAADTGNGNVKTVSTCTPTSVSVFATKPITTKNVLQYNGSYYVIGQGHKEVISDKTQDIDYYILTLYCIGRELARDKVTEASVIIAAGLRVSLETIDMVWRAVGELQKLSHPEQPCGFHT